MYRVALYVHHVMGRETFTSGDLFRDAPDARDWYDERNGSAELRRVILERYGYTDDQWNDVIEASRSIRFVATARERACNEEMERAFRRVMHVIVPEERNYCRALVSAECRRGHFVVVERTGRGHVYRINPAIVDHPEFMRLMRA